MEFHAGMLELVSKPSSEPIAVRGVGLEEMVEVAVPEGEITGFGFDFRWHPCVELILVGLGLTGGVGEVADFPASCPAHPGGGGVFAVGDSIRAYGLDKFAARVDVEFRVVGSGDDGDPRKALNEAEFGIQGALGGFEGLRDGDRGGSGTGYL